MVPEQGNGQAQTVKKIIHRDKTLIDWRDDIE